MIQKEEVSKLTEEGLRALTQTLLKMRCLASPKNWCDQRRALIYQMADVMHNVPQALVEIGSEDGNEHWAIEELKQIHERLQSLLEEYPDLL
ncbi:hypothetical protein RBE51_20085 [Pseudomonas taiwanensis]|uniref:hypothetical protein n=1 Tax=Pseudomonas taiwanensis TaxID=470150 RepID=UPI0028DDCBA0|nr:hypothetical protein [Pseudomonas taiwanensis]MDT8925093.1 hypothetical protein [Pseudomonas taiwanensis]